MHLKLMLVSFPEGTSFIGPTESFSPLVDVQWCYRVEVKVEVKESSAATPTG